MYPNIRWTKDTYTWEVCEMLGTRSEECGPDEFVGKVQLKVPYVDRFALVYHIYMQDCTWPFNPRAFFRSASIKPFLGGAQSTPSIPEDPPTIPDDIIAQTIDYAYALVDLTYSTIEGFQDINGNYVVKKYIETFEPNVEFQIMSPLLFHWGLTPEYKDPHWGRMLSPKEAPARQVRSSVYTVKWLQQDIVPFEYYDLIGCVHDASYIIENFGKKPVDPPTDPPTYTSITTNAETLLYMPGPIEKSIFYKPGALNPGDIGYDQTIHDVMKPPYPGYNFTCKFAYRPYGWNNYFRADHHFDDPPPDPIPDNAYYEPMYRQRKGLASEIWKNYPAKSLLKLLPPPTPPPP